MGAQDFFRRNRMRFAWAALFLQGALMTFVSIAYSLSPPRPDVHAQLGGISIALAQLDHKLTFADLQSAGMFVNVRCRKCDFSAGANITGDHRYFSLDDFENPRFMGSLFKDGHMLFLHFFGENIPAGQQQLDTALKLLRAKFPGRERYIKLVYGDYDDMLREQREPTPP